MRLSACLLVLALAAAAAVAEHAGDSGPATVLAEAPHRQGASSGALAAAALENAAALPSVSQNLAPAALHAAPIVAAAAAAARVGSSLAATAGTVPARTSSSSAGLVAPDAAAEAFDRTQPALRPQQAAPTAAPRTVTQTVQVASVAAASFIDETSKVWPAPGNARRRQVRRPTLLLAQKIAAAAAPTEAEPAPAGSPVTPGAAAVARAAPAGAHTGAAAHTAPSPVTSQAPTSPQGSVPVPRRQKAERRDRAAAAVWLPGGLAQKLDGVLGNRGSRPGAAGDAPNYRSKAGASGTVRSAAVSTEGLVLQPPVSAVKQVSGSPSVSMAVAAPLAKSDVSTSTTIPGSSGSSVPAALAALKAKAAAAAAAAAATSISLAGATGPQIRPDARIASIIRLPDGSKPKSMAFGNGTDLFVSTLVGEVLHIAARPHLPGGTEEDPGLPPVGTPLAKEPGVALTGLAYDPLQHALFAAGSVTGRAYVYFLSPARPYKVTRRLSLPLAHTKKWQAPYVNDVLLGPRHVYFTDSFAPVVHTIPRFASDGLLEAAEAATRGVAPALGIGFVSLGSGFKMGTGLLNANGLTWAADGSLLVSNFAEGYVARAVLPRGSTGNASAPATPAAAAPAAPAATTPKAIGTAAATPAQAAPTDGDATATNVLVTLPVLRAGGRDVWPQVRPDCMVVGETPDVVYLSDNFEDRVLKLRIAPDYSSARVECVIQPTMPDGTVAIRAPTALAFRDGLLWVLNARLLDCPFLLPCTWQQYEAVGIRPKDVCG